jgi:hypothetical protein
MLQANKSNFQCQALLFQTKVDLAMYVRAVASGKLTFDSDQWFSDGFYSFIGIHAHLNLTNVRTLDRPLLS